MLGLMGEKLGMTQVYDEDGRVQPVTVVRAGPCTVVQVKTAETDGYDAIQVGFDTAAPARVNKAQQGHFDKAGTGLFRRLGEFRTSDASAFKVGQVITAAAFQTGDDVDVRGVTKGRGFQGVMKRHGKHGGPASHGATAHRRPGSIGMCAWPGRVFKNMKLPGQMGCTTVLTSHLKIVEVRPEENLLMVKGALPGSRGSLVAIYNRAADFAGREAVKAEPEEDASQEGGKETEPTKSAQEPPPDTESTKTEQQGEQQENAEQKKE